MSNAWILAPIVVINVLFLFLFGRQLGINLSPLPLTPADWIGIVLPNRRGAENNFVLLVLRQYIGATNQLAPIYWHCKHLKNPRNFLSCKMSECLHLLVLPAQVAPIYISVTMKKTWRKIRQKLYTLPRGKQICMGWYWCCQHKKHKYIGATCAGSTNISPYRFVYHGVKCTVFGGFFLHVFFMATDMAPRPPPLPSAKVGTNEN